MYRHRFSARVPSTTMMLVVLCLLSVFLGPTTLVVSAAQNQAGIREVVIAQGADATTLDPQKQSDTDTGNVCMSIFDTLLMRDANMEIQPARPLGTNVSAPLSGSSISVATSLSTTENLSTPKP